MLPGHSQSSLGGWHNFEKRERIGKREGGYLKRGIIPHSELCSRALLVLGTCRKTAWLESYAYFKIYDATAWLTNTVMHTLPNTSRSKFGQLIKYNMRSIFLKNQTQNMGEKLVPCFFFCIIVEGKYFSWYILSIDQVSLSGCLYFVRYWEICVLQLLVNQAMNEVMKFEVFLINPINSINQWSLSNQFIPKILKILGWCPAGTVLPHGEKVPL